MVPLPDPPNSLTAELSTLTAKQLREAQEALWEWIQAAESASFEDAPDDEVLEAAREKLVEVIAERRELHSDEPAPRGG